MAGSLGFASRLGGRGSVTAEQAAAQMYNSGIVSGFVISPATPTANMTVTVGGVAGTPDVMVATNAVGNNVFLKNRNTDAFTLSMTAPASNSVIYSIVGFTDDLSVATSDATSVADNPSKCGVIAVSGTSAASPVAPSDAQIRTAITTAGFTGSQAAYGVLGYVTLTSTTTTITAPNISQTGRTSSLNIAKIYAGTTAGVLTTDSSGSVNPIPYTVMVARKTSTQTINNSTETVVVFNTTSVNDGTAYNNTTGEYTCPTTGRYDVRAVLMFQSSYTGTMSLRVRVNGTAVDTFDTQNPLAYSGTQASTLLSLNANDKITIAMHQNSGSAKTLHNDGNTNFLKIARI